MALERAMAYARNDAVTILDGRFVVWGYADAAMAFNADVITLLDTRTVESYFEVPNLGVLVVRSGEPKKDLDENHIFRILTNTQDKITLDNFVLRVTSENLLYSNRGEDFAEQVRATLEKMRDG